MLQGAVPTKLTVAERMRWTSERLTSRVDDTAYSLMGLFNLFMPMLYREGGKSLHIIARIYHETVRRLHHLRLEK